MERRYEIKKKKKNVILLRNDARQDDKRSLLFEKMDREK